MGLISFEGYQPKQYGYWRSVIETLDGMPEGARQVAEDRFWSKVDIVRDDSSCWEWTAHRVGDGYGSVTIANLRFKAHRVAYELTTGAPIPAGLVLDHLCKVRHCVNPAHLEPVTQRENVQRGDTQAMADAQTRRWAAQTHCKNGHEFTTANTYRPPGDPRQRQCRTCKAARAKGRVSNAS